MLQACLPPHSHYNMRLLLQESPVYTCGVFLIQERSSVKNKALMNSIYRRGLEGGQRMGTPTSLPGPSRCMAWIYPQ